MNNNFDSLDFTSNTPKRNVRILKPLPGLSSDEETDCKSPCYLIRRPRQNPISKTPSECTDTIPTEVSESPEPTYPSPSPSPQKTPKFEEKIDQLIQDLNSVILRLDSTIAKFNTVLSKSTL